MSRSKRGNYTTLDEYFYEKQGYALKDEQQAQSRRYNVYGFDKARKILTEAVVKQQEISIFTDYDCDGITSAAQLYLIVWRLWETLHGLKPDVLARTLAAADVPPTDPDRFWRSKGPNLSWPHIPGRFSEGYGIREKTLASINCSVLILADNGITAPEAILAAKKRGIRTIVFDHHLAHKENGKPVYPDADVLIDPEAIPETADFHSYCGAGLSYKFAEYLLPRDYRLHEILSAFAALGTVADVVSVTGDNRRIIKKGLSVINERRSVAGMNYLAALMEEGRVSTETLGFKLAPAVNAYGRLYDYGGDRVLRALLGSSPAEVADMIAVNVKRKELVEAATEQIRPQLGSRKPFYFIRYERPDGGESSGILGLIAGRAAEITGAPVFCYTEQDGICHGSARSDDEKKNSVYDMLCLAKDHMISFGGHEGAAGFSFRKEEFQAVLSSISAYKVCPHEEPGYDFDLDPKDAESALTRMEQMEPFGKDMERPVFRVKVHFTGDRWWSPVKREGDSENLRFFIPRGNDSLRAVGFGLQPKYIADGEPKDMYLYGTLSWNEYRGNKTPQLQIEDYDLI